MSSEHPSRIWRVWIDTGGTFTDCVGVDPEGRRHRVKVLSSAALRAGVQAVDGRRLRYRAPWKIPDGFADGARVAGLCGDGADLRIRRSRTTPPTLELDGPVAARVGQPFEIRFDEEAPVLAARWITGTPASGVLPSLEMRLATTRGTNALLERRGGRTVLFITRGFADLLEIGNQQRHDLFALDVRRPPPLYEAVVEVPERLAADGTVLEELAIEALDSEIEGALSSGAESAAVALLHSYRNPVHERRLADHLRRRGFRFVATSADLAPVVKILPRAATAVVDAYLRPVIEAYLERVGTAAPRLHVMTSAGGIVRADRFAAKDSLLSGPAGGVVGAAASGRSCGLRRLIAFDMGGTSTDVSRFDGDYEYLFEHRVGDATVAAPALAIETVAAGGGSICRLEEGQLKVGPRSAGADPGPACYRAGGPLTLTDVNLLLGRLDPERFGIPIDRGAAERAAKELLAGREGETDRLLHGFLDIANERMAEAVRRISVRRGYDPRDYALIAFGGAGGQHACAVAGQLAISTVVLPPDAGLLSALGLGAAVVERFSERQVLEPLADLGEAALDARLDELGAAACAEVEAEGVDRAGIAVRRRIAFLRFAGQETALEIERAADASDDSWAAAFVRRYEDLYGYRPARRPIEVESLRVVASSRPAEVEAPSARAGGPTAARPAGERRAYFSARWCPVPVFVLADLRAGERFDGPALVFDDHASLAVEEGWRAEVAAGGAVVLRRSS